MVSMHNKDSIVSSCQKMCEIGLLGFKNDDIYSDDGAMTDPWVRRSTRKPASLLRAERRNYLRDCLLDERFEDLLRVSDHPVKGRCVIAGQPIKKKDFVIEYKGDLVDLKEAKRREEEYAKNPGYGCYMYFFRHREKTYCVDATCETKYKGRLINHSRLKANLVAEVVVTDSLHLAFTATMDIEEGEELLFDYGDRSCTAITYHSWLRD